VLGEAGTGKSWLINLCKSMLTRKAVFLGVTGRAAVNIGGSTIDSFFRMHRGMNLDAGYDYGAAYARKESNNTRTQYYRDLETVFIDEISMLTGKKLEFIDSFLCGVRGEAPGNPFGGVQLVLVGDFRQLLPVTPNEEVIDFLFKHPLWKCFRCVRLRRQHRQGDDEETAYVLQNVRCGKKRDRRTTQVLKSREGTKPPEGVVPVYLFGLVADARNHNATFVADVVSDKHVFDGEDTVQFHDSQLPTETTKAFQKRRVREREKAVNAMWRKSKTSQTLTLFVGANVMLVENLDVERGLCNGATGEVTAFDEKSGDPIVKFQHGISTKIAQKSTTFPPDPTCNWSGAVWQYPLVLGYAYTIHRAQGLTLPHVHLTANRRNMRCTHAFYVALSRCTNINNVYIAGGSLDMDCITTDSEVNQFYRDLELQELNE